jgi:GT2 family glycosyltransferase
VSATISVVVSTHQRPQRLAALLRGLRAQTLAREEFEVVVVDNGSDPATGAVLQAERAAGAITLRTLRHERTLGPAGGRNSGWRAASAPLVAFIDDDCVPAPGWLAAARAAARRNPGSIVQGVTLPDPAELPAPMLISHTVRIERLSGSYETCNIVYPRELLERLGGFDEDFPLRPAGEDTELAWRARRAGAGAVFAPDALVHHAVQRRGYLGTLRDATRWGECARLFALAPPARQILHRRLFWNVWHYLLVRSLLALAAPPWLRRVLWRGHLRALRHRASAAGAGPWAAGYLLIYDAIELGAMLRGSVRHRTLVL